MSVLNIFVLYQRILYLRIIQLLVGWAAAGGARMRSAYFVAILYSFYSVNLSMGAIKMGLLLVVILICVHNVLSISALDNEVNRGEDFIQSSPYHLVRISHCMLYPFVARVFVGQFCVIRKSCNLSCIVGNS